MNIKPLHIMNKKEGNPVKLVWLITLLGFSVGVFIVYLVWSTLGDVRAERDKLFEMKENFNSIQSKLENNLAKEKTEIANLLVATTDDNGKAKNFPLLTIIEDYQRAVPSS